MIIKKAVRYSNDIDFALKGTVSKREISKIIGRIKHILVPWLGKPRINIGNRITITFRLKSVVPGSAFLRLKLDIDTVENYSVLEYNETQFSVQNGYFTGHTKVRTLQLEECIAKKMRALGTHNRIKGRDLFDIWYALVYSQMDVDKMLDCFLVYMKNSGNEHSREHYEKMLDRRLSDPAYRADTDDLIVDVPDWDFYKAGNEVRKLIISKLPSQT